MFFTHKKHTETLKPEESTINQEREEPEMNVNEPLDRTKLHTDMFEAIASIVIEHETVMNSPIDGSPIGVVRTEDVLNSITEYFGIDIGKTKFSEYRK
jgi:hypothetical protein